MSRDTETGAAQRSSIVGHLVRSLFSTWTPREANFYTNRDTTEGRDANTICGS